MGKVTKVTIKYKDGNLPAGLSDLFDNADKTDLRILAAVLMLAGAENSVASVTELPALLGLEQSEVDASLKFWRGAGLLGNAKSDTAKQTKLKKECTPTAASSTAHRNGVLERSGTLENYSSAELAELMEKRRVSAQFIDEAQRILGKVFRTYDTGILVGIVDQLGFEEEAVLAILSYIAGRGKKTLRYAEQVAMGLHDAGITETTAVLERINRMERSGEVIAKIRVLFGASGRELTATEKRLFTTWTETYAYDTDVIRLAYDITVDTIQKPAPKYTNSILEKWYAEGLRTADDVGRYLQEQQEMKQGAQTAAKSYDIDDFFEAALQRSFDET